MKPCLNEMLILYEFRPYLRLLRAFHYQNFHHSNWSDIVHSILDAVCLTLVILLAPIMIMLGLWYLIETNGDLTSTVESLPVLCSLTQMLLAFIAMIINNRAICETIEQLQNVINQRESYKLNNKIE